MRKIKELMSLEGRSAVISGGAGHIGATLCETLAELGANVAILDINQQQCESVSSSLVSFDIDVLPISIDISNERHVRDVPDKILSKFGRIDILVNCAAFVGTSNLEGWVTPFLEQSSKTWREAMEVNLTSAFILSQACTPALNKSNNGSIINIGSIHGLVGPDMGLYEGTSMGSPVAYAVSKGGLLQLTKWLATVLAPNIRVNTISPGGVWRNQDQIFQERYLERTPLKRMATEEDLKGACAYLASDLSKYVTGQNIVVDGGWTAW